MNKNMNRHHIKERTEELHRCDWYSKINQQRYWQGSPWRAIAELLD